MRKELLQKKIHVIQLLKEEEKGTLLIINLPQPHFTGTSQIICKNLSLSLSFIYCSIICPAGKKRKRTVVTGDMKPMTDTLNQVIIEEIKPFEKERMNSTTGNTAKKVFQKSCFVTKMPYIITKVSLRVGVNSGKI